MATGREHLLPLKRHTARECAVMDANMARTVDRLAADVAELCPEWVTAVDAAAEANPAPVLSGPCFCTLLQLAAHPTSDSVVSHTCVLARRLRSACVVAVESMLMECAQRSLRSAVTHQADTGHTSHLRPGKRGRTKSRCGDFPIMYVSLVCAATPEHMAAFKENPYGSHRLYMVEVGWRFADPKTALEVPSYAPKSDQADTDCHWVLRTHRPGGGAADPLRGMFRAEAKERMWWYALQLLINMLPATPALAAKALSLWGNGCCGGDDDGNDNDDDYDGAATTEATTREFIELAVRPYVKRHVLPAFWAAACGDAPDYPSALSALLCHLRILELKPQLVDGTRLFLQEQPEAIVDISCGFYCDRHSDAPRVNRLLEAFQSQQMRGFFRVRPTPNLMAGLTAAKSPTAAVHHGRYYSRCSNEEDEDDDDCDGDDLARWARDGGHAGAYVYRDFDVPASATACKSLTTARVCVLLSACLFAVSCQELVRHAMAAVPHKQQARLLVIEAAARVRQCLVTDCVMAMRRPEDAALCRLQLRIAELLLAIPHHTRKKRAREFTVY